MCLLCAKCIIGEKFTDFAKTVYVKCVNGGQI